MKNNAEIKNSFLEARKHSQLKKLKMIKFDISFLPKTIKSNKDDFENYKLNFDDFTKFFSLCGTHDEAFLLTDNDGGLQIFLSKFKEKLINFELDLKYLNLNSTNRFKKLNNLIENTEKSIIDYLGVMGDRSDYIHHNAYMTLIEHIESVLLTFLEIKKEFSELIQEELFDENEVLLYDSFKKNLEDKKNENKCTNKGLVERTSENTLSKAELWYNAVNAIIRKDYDLFNKSLATVRQELTNEEFLKFVNEKDLQGTTLLYVAVFKGDETFVNELLAAGANLNQPNDEDLLYFAATRGDKKVVAQLLEAGVNVNRISTGGTTALAMTSISRHVDIVTQLLAAGAGICDHILALPKNITFDHQVCIWLTYQHFPITRKTLGFEKAITNLDELDEAIQQGVNLNREALIAACDNLILQNSQKFSLIKIANAIKDKLSPQHFQSPMNEASNKYSQHNSEQLFDALVDATYYNDAQEISSILAISGKSLVAQKGYLKNTDGLPLFRNPLLIAAARGYDDIVAQLITAGIDVNCIDDAKKTSLHHAAKYGHHKVVAQLLAAKADVNVLDTFQRLPLCDAVEGGYDKVVAQLLAARSKLDYTGYFGSLFHLAKNHDKIVAQLITAAVEVNGRSMTGQTPLHEAAYWGYEKVVAQLIAAKAQLDLSESTGQQRTALHIAIYGSREKIVALLIASGANINKKEESWNGKSPLEVAISCGFVSIVSQLIAAGADVTDCISSLRLAGTCKDQLASLLFDAGAGICAKNPSLPSISFINQVVIGMKIDNREVSRKTPGFEKAITNIDELDHAIKQGVHFNRKALLTTCDYLLAKDPNNQLVKSIKEKLYLLSPVSLVNLCFNVLNKPQFSFFRKITLNKTKVSLAELHEKLIPDENATLEDLNSDWAIVVNTDKKIEIQFDKLHINFEETNYPINGAWHLQASNGKEQPFMVVIEQQFKKEIITCIKNKDINSFLEKINNRGFLGNRLASFLKENIQKYKDSHIQSHVESINYKR